MAYIISLYITLYTQGTVDSHCRRMTMHLDVPGVLRTYLTSLPRTVIVGDGTKMDDMPHLQRPGQIHPPPRSWLALARRKRLGAFPAAATNWSISS